MSLRLDLEVMDFLICYIAFINILDLNEFNMEVSSSFQAITPGYKMLIVNFRRDIFNQSDIYKKILHT